MPIEIVDANPQWPERFADIGAKLRLALGDLAVRIDHIGSTSVSGLAAKDIIDVQVTVADLDANGLGAAVEQTGLAFRPDIVSDHEPPGRSLPGSELRKRYAQGKAINCHIRELGRFNQRYALLCRDYLRTHAESARAYESIKRQLARHFVDDPGAYYDIKDPVFDIIMEGAFAWADATDWSPGASDA